MIAYFAWHVVGSGAVAVVVVVVVVVVVIVAAAVFCIVVVVPWRSLRFQITIPDGAPGYNGTVVNYDAFSATINCSSTDFSGDAQAWLCVTVVLVLVLVLVLVCVMIIVIAVVTAVLPQ